MALALWNLPRQHLTFFAVDQQMKPTPTKPTRPRTVRFEISIRSMIAAVLVLLAVWLVVHLLPVLLVLVAALMLVGTLTPIVAWLESRKLHRNVAILHDGTRLPVSRSGYARLSEVLSQ